MRKRRSTQFKDEYLDTELHAAVLARDIDALKKSILEHPENINKKNSDISTPLDLAISTANFQAIDLLIENGADLNAHNREGLAPMHQLIKNVDYFLLHEISHETVMDTAMKIIAKGAILDIQDRRGNTLINFVAQKAKTNKLATKTYTRLGALILSRDTNAHNTVQIKNNMGKTPMDYLSRNGNLILREEVYACRSAKTNNARLSNIIAETELILKRNSELEKTEA